MKIDEKEIEFQVIREENNGTWIKPKPWVYDDLEASWLKCPAWEVEIHGMCRGLIQNNVFFNPWNKEVWVAIPSSELNS